MPTASAEERSLHSRLLARDPTASVELCEAYLEPVTNALRQQFATIAQRDETIILDAATDALLNYIESPEQFDPERGQLLWYLKMSARGDLLNALKKREKDQEKRLDFVELQEIWRNKVLGDPGQERDLDAQKIWTRIRQIVPDPTDQALVRLLLAGVRKYDAYAEVMGIMALPQPKRDEEVKRAKDRLKKRLKRADWTGYIDPADR